MRFFFFFFRILSLTFLVKSALTGQSDSREVGYLLADLGLTQVPGLDPQHLIR